MTKQIIKFLEEWWQVIVIAVIASLFIGLIGYEIARPKIIEGMVMNKWISPAYSDCNEKGNCSYTPAKYIIAVQEGDTKDWWYVTEQYYDSVKIGDWVTK